ncbi:TetR/AcrR family transcriptional regulator [Rhodococcus opacus]|uniref:TetR/AcrR family transcriptional regulator n=1 Tax=Rhodococcus opacus TaxID=37919 RepID=UPI002236AA0D|nr:TetR/AcrR family transcriptional regulator [Rhodococcus opacus]UZG60360.1 TetR family transcriptional regulator [Rhodococcus opacus]
MTASARERILDAAITLMATKAPSQIAGREIAKQAGVNYGLIHRHFGSKNNACKEAFQRLAGDYVRQVRGGHEGDWILSMRSEPEHQDLWRILAHSAMDGDSLAILGWDYPLLRDRLAARVSTSDQDADSAQTKIATAFSLAFGWTVFQPFLVEALALAPDDFAEVDAAITRRIGELW